MFNLYILFIIICMIYIVVGLFGLSTIIKWSNVMIVIFIVILFIIIIIDNIFDYLHKKNITKFTSSMGWEILELRRAKPWERGPFSRYLPDKEYIYVIVVRTESGEIQNGWVRGSTGDIRWDIGGSRGEEGAEKGT